MILQLLQVILILGIFLPVRYLAYYITEVKGLPVWLDYKPFNCRLCLTFWSLIAAYLTSGIILGFEITLYGGILLTILNAIAMYINQKNKTIKV